MFEKRVHYEGFHEKREHQKGLHLSKKLRNADIAYSLNKALPLVF